jgi:hypothetical protein
MERNVKHFSEVQNKQIFYNDLELFKNRIMMNIEVPTFLTLDPKLSPTAQETNHFQRLN